MTISEEQLIPFHSTDLTGKRVLVLAPHPDDETFGCGGSLAIHTAAGDSVKVIFLTNGARGDMTGRYERNAYISLRQNEARSACAELGISDIEFWPYEDRTLAECPDALERLIFLLNDFCPELVYAPSSIEFHPDHRAAAVLIFDAVKKCSCGFDIVSYEVGQPLQVNLLVDITPVLECKKRAVQKYSSQLKEKPYDDITFSLNRFRSLTLPENVMYAEGFCMHRRMTDQFDFSVFKEHFHPEWQTDKKGAPFVVIIRTQGERHSQIQEALLSISVQANPCLAVVVVHAGEEALRAVEHICSLIPRFPHVLIHANEISKPRGYPLNSGLQYAYNCGIGFSGIFFLDDDDIVYPFFTQKMLQAFLATRADVIYAASNRRNPGHPLEAGYRPRHSLNLLIENFIPINSYAVRFELLKEKRLFFDETLDVTEDWHFLLRLMENGFRFEPISETLSEFRILSDGNSPVKQQPELWAQASRSIRNYINRSNFSISGCVLVSAIASINRNIPASDTKIPFLENRIKAVEDILLNLNDKGRVPFETACNAKCSQIPGAKTLQRIVYKAMDILKPRLKQEGK